MKLPEKIIDANVILRFFLEDDEERFVKAKPFIQRLELTKEEALKTDIVFVELVWVLNKVYDVPRPEIAKRFSKLINYKGIKTVFIKELYVESLKLYAKHSMDIQDILLVLIAGIRIAQSQHLPKVASEKCRARIASHEIDGFMNGAMRKNARIVA